MKKLTFKQIRDGFFQTYNLKREYKNGRPKDQNDYCTDTRVFFCDYVDYLLKDGQITCSQADRVTLK